MSEGAKDKVVAGYERLLTTLDLLLEKAQSNEWDEVIKIHAESFMQLDEVSQLQQAYPSDDLEVLTQRQAIMKPVIERQYLSRAMVLAKRDEIAKILDASEKQKNADGFPDPVQGDTYSPRKGKRKRL